VTSAVDIAGIERRLAERVGVRQFVEQEDREVGSDQRNVDEWKAPGRNATDEGIMRAPSLLLDIVGHRRHGAYGRDGAMTVFAGTPQGRPRCRAAHRQRGLVVR